MSRPQIRLQVAVAVPPLAEKEEGVITRHGKPTGILIGFESEDDWFDHRLAYDPRFLRRVEVAWASSKLSPTAGY
jgi:hypothetical protein